MASNPPLRIMSDDPEVMALQAMIKGARHFQAKALTNAHWTILAAVELCIKATKVNPNAKQIAIFAQMEPEEFEQELTDLVERRYLATIVNTFGALDIRYKIGPTGGTALRQMLDRKKKPKSV